jgi:hypothetical protein
VFTVGAPSSLVGLFMSEFKDGGEASGCLVGLFTFQLIRSFN